MNHQLLLKESIKHFLELHQNGSSDFSSFETIFFRLIQTMLDPPVEITWFYSAVSFHAAKCSSQKNDLSTRLLIVKDLLNLHISCSNLSSTPKKIVLLAPVVYELYNILSDFQRNDLSVKYEVSNLLDKITNYIMLFAGIHDCGGKGVVEFQSMAACFEDLVRVWTADRGGGGHSMGETLEAFFPVLSGCIWTRVNSVQRGMQELVGIVLFEVFLLQLCLNFGSSKGKEGFLEGTKTHAVNTIKAFRNCYFPDILFKTLLEGCLPVKALLCYTDAVLLQKVLYDAVVLIDYSFYFGRWSHSPENQPKKLALLWLLVADRAIRFAWSANEMVTAISYLNAFGESQIVTEIIKWAKLQAGIVDPINRLHIRTPQVLIEWLLILEEHGITIFDDESLALAKGVLSEPRIESCPLFIDLTSYAVDKGQEIGEALASNENDFNEGQVGYVSTSNEVINEGLEIGSVLHSNELDVNEGRESKDVFGSSRVYVQEGPEFGEPLSDDPSFANVEAESSKKRKTAFLNDVSDPQHKHLKHGDRPGSVTAGDDFIYLTSDDDMDEV